MFSPLILSILTGVLGFAFIYTALSFRRVVKTNEVHIVQTSKETKSFGKDTQNGNVYYNFPSWIPVIGVSVIVLPTSNFSIKINDYDAYDVERLPFKVDLTAFFRISESNLAAQRVSSFHDLHEQLEQIIKGSARSILSSKHLNNVLQIRSELGEDFTASVSEQLKNWGVEPVKTIELMDIRDSEEGHVIHNIMAIKQSDIERESRTKVAENKKLAEIAEIEAEQEANVKKQHAEKVIGLKKVETEREVNLSNQEAAQIVEESRKITTEKQMAVKQLENIKQAEIEKEVALINAEKEQKQREIMATTDKQVQIVKAEAEKQTQILVAEGNREQAFLNAAATLEMKEKEAQGISKIGAAEAESKKLLEISLVSGQIQLAKEIGENSGYQEYLIRVRQIEANEKIGVEQAHALSNADLKLIINDGGNAQAGLNKISNMLSGNGGAQLGNMLESISQYPKGAEIINKFLNQNTNQVVKSTQDIVEN